MITMRKANERGHADYGWLDTNYSFSFAEYYDPEQMGFSVLRVINDDRVTPGAGFPTHPHSDMEIVSYVLEGTLEHKDSMGNRSIIRPGEVQRMSAGTGITHSEYNASSTEQLRFLQIWILPERAGIEPSYEQRAFAADERKGKLCLTASPDGRDGSVAIHQDARLYAGLLGEHDSVSHHLRPGRKAYLHVACGDVRLDGQTLGEGDGARIDGEETVRLHGIDHGEVLLFDLPG